MKLRSLETKVCSAVKLSEVDIRCKSNKQRYQVKTESKTYVLVREGMVKFFASKNNQARSKDNTVIPSMI